MSFESRVAVESSPPRVSYLRDFVYGAVDGAVTTFAIVAGAAGANLDSSVVVILGVANQLADGLSMAVSNYLGSRAEQQEREQLGLTPEFGHPVRAALATFLAFIVAGTLPLLAYLVNAAAGDPIADPFAWSLGLTAVAFFSIGAVKALWIRRSWWRSGLETLAIGGAAAAVAYVVGVLLSGVA